MREAPPALPFPAVVRGRERGTDGRACLRLGESLENLGKSGKVWQDFSMAAALLRQARIRNVLPVAVAQGWPVRRLAREAGIGWGAAGEALRAVRQHVATAGEGEMAAVCGESAARLRESIGRAAAALVRGIEKAAEAVETRPDAGTVEKLGRALEVALRITDGIDGLKHRRDMEKAIVGRLDGEQLAAALAPQGSDSFRDAEALSVESICAVAVRKWERGSGARQRPALDGPPNS